MLTATSPISEREQAFQDANGNLEDSALLVPYLLVSLLLAEQKIVGEKVVREMAEPVLERFGVRDRCDWAEALIEEQNGAFSEFEIGSCIHLLDAYARFGIDYVADRERSIREIAELRREDLARVEPLEDLLIVLHSEPDLADRAAKYEDFFRKTLAATRSRIALDTGERVPVEGIAVLTGISESRMRSIAKRSADAVLPIGDDRKVANDRAKTWLEDQDRFLPTVNRESEAEEEREIPDPIFVPVAADGSRFDVTLRHGDGYQIGPKGKEENFATYEEALAALTRMPVACWRRPSEGSGRRGIVRATHWERVSRMDIMFHEGN